MEGRCLSENSSFKYFLLMENVTLRKFSLNVGTIIVKDEEKFYFYYPAARNTSENSETMYIPIFTVNIEDMKRAEGKNLTAEEQKDLIEKCLTVGSKIQLNNIKHKITCFLENKDPDGNKDFSGYLKCEDGMTIKIQDIVNQVNQVNQQKGGRYSRSRKRTYKRKSKSRRKKRAF